LAYQPPVSSTFLSEQTSHQQPASSTLLSEQTSTSHQPPANRTGWEFVPYSRQPIQSQSGQSALSDPLPRPRFPSASREQARARDGAAVVAARHPAPGAAHPRPSLRVRLQRRLRRRIRKEPGWTYIYPCCVHIYTLVGPKSLFLI
jgi:hypothetical protein